jgi:hypothetical protein
VFAIAGTQAGKTSFGPLWLWREYQRCGPGDYLAVTATYSLLRLKMLPEFLRLWQGALGLGSWRASEKTFALNDGESRIIFGSATNPESLESATAQAAWIDECGQDQFRVESWEAVQRRVSLAQGRVLGTTTPYNLGWIKQQVFDRFEAGDPDYDVIQFPSVANPAFPPAEDERARATLANWKYQMFYRGQLTRPGGLIYDAYSDEPRELGGHRVHPFDLPASWPRYVGLDFGGVNTAKVYVAHDPEADVYYVYAADLAGGLTSAEHAREVLERTRGVNRVAVWGGSKSEEQQRRDFRLEDLVVQGPPVVDVEAGIDRVYGLFKTHRLYVFDDCAGLRDELGTYRRRIDPATGEATQTIVDKETFHRLDALRYVASGILQPRNPWRLV